MTTLIEGMHPGDKYTLGVKDFRLPNREDIRRTFLRGKLGGQWITQDTIVTGTQGETKLVTFDFKSQKWSDLIAGDFVNWAVSRMENISLLRLAAWNPRSSVFDSPTVRLRLLPV